MKVFSKFQVILKSCFLSFKVLYTYDKKKGKVAEWLKAADCKSVEDSST